MRLEKGGAGHYFLVHETRWDTLNLTRVRLKAFHCQMKSPVRSTSQLAKSLGLSRWTVSRALNGHSGLNPETIKRVQEAARQSGFSPSILGRALRTGKTNLIGVCLPDLVDYFLTNKISRLQDAVEARGFHAAMLLTNGSEERESAAIENFAAMHCAGVVAIASCLKPSAPAIRNLALGRIPVVLIDPLHPAEDNVVATDRAYGMECAMDHFHQNGHRRVVALGIDRGTAYGMQRVVGIRNGCRAHGWKFERDVLFLNASVAGDDFELGAALANEYLKLPEPRIRAIVTLNDRIAVGAMHVLQTRGLNIPKDVTIIGYDNGDFSAHTNPPLTTIDPQVPQLIDAAVETLLNPTPSKTKSPQLIKPKLIVRQS